MLSMELQIGFRDPVGVGHVVVDRRSRQPMCTRTVFLGPANGGVDRDIGNVNTLWHQFSCHALREAGLGMEAIAKAPLDGKPLSAALAFVKMIVPFAPLALSFLLTEPRTCEHGTWLDPLGAVPGSARTPVGSIFFRLLKRKEYRR
jgi:hypothetical protein